tara:strand:+ start:114 stop:875 length:762 start_codon:yes stop_codon:yes gene_type:complete
MKLTNALEKYNFDPSPEDIMNIIFDFENGIRNKTLARKYLAKELIIRKIVDEYGYHASTISVPQIKAHWIENKLWDYMQSLSLRLGKDVSVNYNAESFIKSLEEQTDKKKYNSNDLFYKHFTKTNRVNYNAQKSMAKKRGISWEFNSFEEWITWWLQTGKFDQRGVTNECYQMCRIGDAGPYSPSNVYCDTGKQNKDLYWHNNAKQHDTKRKKPIKTPFGLFDSRTGAASAHNITLPGLAGRIKRHPTEYYDI